MPTLEVLPAASVRESRQDLGWALRTTATAGFWVCSVCEVDLCRATRKVRRVWKSYHSAAPCGCYKIQGAARVLNRLKVARAAITMSIDQDDESLSPDRMHSYSLSFTCPHQGCSAHPAAVTGNCFPCMQRTWPTAGTGHKLAQQACVPTAHVRHQTRPVPFILLLPRPHCSATGLSMGQCNDSHFRRAATTKHTHFSPAQP